MVLVYFPVTIQQRRKPESPIDVFPATSIIGAERMPRRKITVHRYYLGPSTETFTESFEALEGDGSLNLERLEEKWGVGRLIAFVKMGDDGMARLNRCKGSIHGNDVKAGLNLSFADHICVTDHVLFYPGPPSEMTVLYNRIVRWCRTLAPRPSTRKDVSASVLFLILLFSISFVLLSCF